MEGQRQVGVLTLATAALQQQLGQGLGAALDALMTHLSKEACQQCQAALDSCHTLTRYTHTHTCLASLFETWTQTFTCHCAANIHMAGMTKACFVRSIPGMPFPVRICVAMPA